MGLMQTAMITGASVWKASDHQNSDEWIFHFSPADLEEIDAALKVQQGSSKPFPHFDKADFPLPKLEPRLAGIAEELEDGRGFVLLRGLPIERYSDEEINVIYYGLGLNLGLPVGQNPQGDLIGTVMNVGDPADKNTRVYQTNKYLPYHTDPSDVVGLLCIRKAKSGGLSSLVSVHAVYNELLERYPEFLGLLQAMVLRAFGGRPSQSHIALCHA